VDLFIAVLDAHVNQEIIEKTAGQSKHREKHQGFLMPHSLPNVAGILSFVEITLSTCEMSSAML
jgi:hypothetical protein